jgi:hypothetical protein
MRSPEMFGGMPPEMGKKPESAEQGHEAEGEAIELVPYDELLTNVGEQMGKVVRTLEEERKLSDEIRKMGGKVTRETAERVMDLERQKNGLIEVYMKTLEPVRKDAFEAFLDRAQYVVEKPANMEELMTDPEVLEVTDDMIIETQSSDELASLEKELVDESDKAQQEMLELIEGMHEAAKEPKPSMPDLGDPEIRKAYLGILQSRYDDLQERLRHVDDAAAREEMKQLDAKILPMMAEDIEAMAAQEQAAAQLEIKKAHVAMMQARFDELQNYVRAIGTKLKDVRSNLGFARKMDQKEGRTAA